jgi:hypothetical protein
MVTVRPGIFMPVSFSLILPVITPMITANKELILKEKFVELTFDPENRIVEARWIGFLKLDEVKSACKLLTQFVGQHTITRHLSDQTQLKVLSREVQEYLIGECVPELDSLGIRKIAVLVSADVFAQATVNNVNIKSRVGNLSFGTFESYRQCIDFLTRN